MIHTCRLFSSRNQQIMSIMSCASACFQTSMCADALPFAGNMSNKLNNYTADTRSGSQTWMRGLENNKKKTQHLHKQKQSRTVKVMAESQQRLHDFNMEQRQIFCINSEPSRVIKKINMKHSHYRRFGFKD